ncbi:nucleolar protein dao-5 [Wyeomyia smithii]|uniref:nucleolar protein dao-5 n=1 Tax=Wyeomyia smithii TaxID=174621 RepID=UPI002467BFE6|nr:nucleolar protein dao-5 [Wyeomyia smithii]
MPRLKKKEEPVASPTDAAVTLTAGRSRRTIKPNRKYLNDSVVLATTSKNSSRSSTPDSDNSADEFPHADDDDDEVPSKPSIGRRSVAASRVHTPTGKPRGRPRKSGIVKAVAKTEPIKNLRKEVMKKMDLTTLNIGKPRVVLTPINKMDIKRRLDLDQSIEKGKPITKPRPSVSEKVSKPEEKTKPDVRPMRKRQQESPVAPEKPDSLKKVINPVAVKKHQVEKSILVNRNRKEPTVYSDESDDEVQIVGISRETAPFLGRKSAGKGGAVATKQVTPANVRVMKSLSAGKETQAVSALNKRKLEESDEEMNVKGAKKRLPSKAAKLSVTADSEDEEDGDDEPFRRSTRSSLLSDKSSATSTPQNISTTKAKESPASGGMKFGRSSEGSKPNLTRTASMPALDKSKAIIRPAITKLSAQLGSKSSVIMKSSPQPNTPKSTLGMMAEKKSKSEMNLVDPICSPEKGPKAADKGKLKNATIRIVDIGDIIKNKSASTPDINRAGLTYKKLLPKESDAQSEDSEDSDGSPTAEKPKTNNQLVASILERKRPINLDHLRINRTGKRGRPSISGMKTPTPLDKSASKIVRPSVIDLAEEDEIDFEDMLQTNIVTANTVQKGTIQKVIPGRQRSSNLPDENIARSGRKTPVARSTVASNNNNVYKSNNNGRFGSQSSANRSGSASPHKNPPRILNSTMKLGDGRPFAKLVANSGDKHYSIDLTDPDNDVKLIASPGSPTLSPVKRTPSKVVPRPIVTSGGLRNASNALNKPVGGAVQRSVSSLTSSVGSSPKMKKITCYETWYVINIPNNENKPERPSFAMSMIGLGNIAGHVQLPSTEWSHKIILTKRKVSPLEGEEVFNGDVEDRAISEDEKRNYEPCNIMFRRKTAIPGKFNLQYDRAVIFKNDTFFINVDGKNCQLVGAPNKLDDTEDIETLLAVVDFVNLKNNCVELSTA